MLPAVDQPANYSAGYATEDTDDEDIAPAQTPARLWCGVPVPGFGRSFLTTLFVCAPFIVCAAAAPLTASGVGGASEHVCSDDPPVGGAGADYGRGRRGGVIFNRHVDVGATSSFSSTNDSPSAPRPPLLGTMTLLRALDVLYGRVLVAE
ncbi:hypothetical protein CYMTET_16574 [Cymbomonas tetramitiformis]|uniref:Uncharacterized protein n=1 Tax=Cymbomonas tetramitiformis TaxID=36881 RepID=A0AAE0L7V7_9CHLO|nr:hypothetical protein CYMTET_16574 [Cymbomonas tetramitiformis]